MDNSEAIGKLLKIIHAADPWSNHDYVDEAHEILDAIQADLLAYVQPKSLEWVYHSEGYVGTHYKAITVLGNIYVGPRKSDGKFEWSGLTHDWSDECYPTLKAAQAAAYDDLCKRVGELF